MTGWLIRVKHGTGYIWKRKFFLGIIAIPWFFHGGTRIIMTPDINKDVILASIEYIYSQDSEPSITLTSTVTLKI